jgi:hypothetical protein
LSQAYNCTTKSNAERDENDHSLQTLFHIEPLLNY